MQGFESLTSIPPVAWWVAALTALALAALSWWLRRFFPDRRWAYLTFTLFGTFVVTAISWALFSEWRTSPLLLVLMALAFNALLQIAVNLRDLLEPKETRPPPPPPPPPEPPPPGGAVPAPRVAVYIDRGPIEQEVRARLRSKSDRIAAIVGLNAPGGVGKTELARRAARELAPEFEKVLEVAVGDKTREQVLADLAAACGIQLQPKWTYTDRVKAVQAYLSERHYLLLFDDVRDQTARHLHDFIPPCPPCAALVTSRIQNLSHAIPAGATLTLDRMTPEQARQLLAAALTEAALAAEPEAVEKLMERCRYNPLALEIAARRIRQRMGARQPIAAALATLKTLRDLRVGSDPRLDLFAVFDLSYQELSEADKKRFRWLAAFASTGFSRDGALAVWGEASEQAGDVLENLLNLSLLKAVDGGRFRLHDLLDEYAVEKLKEAGEEQAARAAHANWLVALFSREENAFPDPGNMDNCRPELDNLRTAANWATGQGNGTLLAQLATAPRNWLYVVFDTAQEEWLDWLQTALRLGIEDRGLQANVLQAIGDVQQFRDDRDAALQSYAQALALFQAVGDRLGEANVYWSRGRLQLLSGDGENGLRELQEALNLYEQIGNLSGAANVYFFLGQVLASTGHFAQAADMLQQAVALGERIDKHHPVTVYMQSVLNEVRQRATSTPPDTPKST